MNRTSKWAISIGAAIVMGACFSAHESSADAAAAIVNGESISARDFEKAFAGNLAVVKTRSKVTPAVSRQLRARVLDRMIDDKLLDQKARKMGMVVEEAEIDSKLAAMRARFATSDELEAKIERAGTTERAMRDAVRMQLLRDHTVEQIGGEVRVRDADVDSAFVEALKGARAKEELVGTPEKVRATKEAIKKKLEMRAREKQRATIAKSLRAAATIDREPSF